MKKKSVLTMYFYRECGHPFVSPVFQEGECDDNTFAFSQCTCGSWIIHAFLSPPEDGKLSKKIVLKVDNLKKGGK